MSIKLNSSWPSFSAEEIKVVSEVLLSNKVNYWTGEEGRLFENEFASMVGCDHAIAVANGTLALDVAFNALGVGKGDEVIVTSRTFLASVSSIINAGAKPVFADVDPNSQNITKATISPLITSSTRAIVCVHLAGWPCEMDPILELADKHSLFVIEDCAQAHGAKYNGRSVGSIGHIGAWSFCQDKIMTTGGEGGMITTNDEELWSKMWSYKDHGKSWNAVNKKEHPPGFRWLHESFGTNMRLTEMQSAIGRVQLRQLDDWHSKRLHNCERIWSIARSFESLRVPVVPVNIKHAAYKCYVFIEQKYLKSGWDRDRVVNYLNDLGVPCFTGSCSEVYLEKAFDGTCFRPAKRLPVAKELGETSIMFLVHPTLSDTEMKDVCETFNGVMLEASI